jgi:hypothetical protein
MKRSSLATSLISFTIILFAGCKQTNSAKMMFDTSYTRSTMTAACANLGAACIGLGNSEISGYETRLRTSFASDPQCEGINLVGSATTYSDREALTKDAEWRLEIDWLPPLGETDSRLNWSLVDSKNHQYEGELSEVKRSRPTSDIHSVCSIVKNRGGQIR